MKRLSLRVTAALLALLMLMSMAAPYSVAESQGETEPEGILQILPIEDQQIRIIYAKPGVENAVDWGIEPLVVTVYTSEPYCELSFTDSAGILGGSFSEASHNIGHEVLTLVANGQVGTTTVTITAEKDGAVATESFEVFVTEFYDTGEYDWGELKIHGAGAVTGYIFHPTVPDILYAATDVGGAWRFNFETKSWEDITRWITPTTASVGQSRGVGIDATPGREDWVYLAYGGSGTMLRSTDRGESWYGVGNIGINMGGNAGNSRGLGGDNIVSVPQPKPQAQWIINEGYDNPLDDPANYNAPMVYALSHGGIRRNTTMTETDNGSWVNIASMFGNSGGYSCMHYAADNPNLQFVGAGGPTGGTDLAYYSKDNGATFSKLPGQPLRRSTVSNYAFYFPTKAAFTAPFSADTLPAFDENAEVGDRYLLVTYNDPGDNGFGVTDGWGVDGCVYRWLIAADGTVKGNGSNITPLAIDGTYVRYRGTAVNGEQNRMIGVGMSGMTIDPQIPGAMVVSTIISYNYVRDKRYAHFGYDTLFRSLDYGETWFPILCGYDMYGDIENIGEGSNYANPRVNGDFFADDKLGSLEAALEAEQERYIQESEDYWWEPWTPVHWMFTPKINPFDSNFLIFNTGVGPYVTYNLTELDQLAAEKAEPNAKTQYGLTDEQARGGFYKTWMPTAAQAPGYDQPGMRQEISTARKTSNYTPFRLHNSINNLTNEQSVAWHTSPGLFMTVQKVSAMYSPPSGKNIALTNTWDYPGWAFEGLDHVPWNGWSFAQWIPERYEYLFEEWREITANTDPKYLPPKPTTYTNEEGLPTDATGDILGDIYAPTNRGISGDNTDYVDANPDIIVSTMRTDWHFNTLGGVIISFDGGGIWHTIPDGHVMGDDRWWFFRSHPSTALMGKGEGMPTTALQTATDGMKINSDRMIGNVAIGADAKTLVWGLSSLNASIGNQVVTKADDPINFGQEWFRPTFYNASGSPTTSGNVRVFADRVDPDVFYAFGTTSYVSRDGAVTFHQATITATDGNTMPAISNANRHVKGEVGNPYTLWVDGDGYYKLVYNKETNTFASTRVVGTSASATTFAASSRSGIGLGTDGENAVANSALYVHGSYTAQNGNGNSGIGIYRSLDGGQTWTKISPTVAAHPQPAGTRNDPYLNANFSFADVRSVVGDPRTFGRVYLSQGNVAGGSRYGDMITEPVVYNVNYVVSGTELGIAQSVRSGMTAENLSEIAGVPVSGWYTDEILATPYDFGPVSEDITLYAAVSSVSDPVITSVTVTTPTIVETLAANLRINVEGENLEGYTLTAYLSVDDVIDETTAAGIINGTGLMKISKAPAADADCKVVVKVNGTDVLNFCTMTLGEYNPDKLWNPGLDEDDDGNLLIRFAETIAAGKNGYKITVDGKPCACTTIDDTTLGTDVSFLSLEGATIVVSGVKYPDLFPSYSFTFTLLVP